MLSTQDISTKVQGFAKNITPDFKNWEDQTWPQLGASTADINVGKWERIGSTLLGAFLLYRTVRAVARRPSISNVLSGSLGVSLIKRGLSGHCGAYEANGISTAGRGMKATV